MIITRVDVAALVHDAVDTARASDPSRSWLYEGPDRASAVHGDADRLRQVVDNALANVRVHTPPGTTATTRAHALERDVVIEVTDDGPGLPQPALPRIFDRFWRHDRSRSRASGGSGLGLAIAAGIVSAHHGHIEATSADGKGLPQDRRRGTGESSAPSGKAKAEGKTGDRTGLSEAAPAGGLPAGGADGSQDRPIYSAAGPTGLTITITLPSASGGGRDTERSIEQLGITEPAP